MSGANTASKLEKEKLKLIQEKCQSLLNDMLRDEDNKYCVDCDAKGPRWASWNLGIFLCIRCAGIHRNLGVHISRVKSVNLDTWTPEQVVTMQHMGNSRARAVYEATMPDNFRRPQTDVALENFIRAKYEHKKYIAQEWVQPSIPKVNWDTEIEDSLRKKKEAKKQSAEGVTLANFIPKPKHTATNSAITSTNTTKTQNPPPITAATAATAAANNVTTETNGKTSNPSDDLLGLMGGNDFLSSSSVSTSDPFASPVKATNASATPSSNIDDLGGLFGASGGTNGTDANSKKMTKESILSLYGQGTSAPPPQANPFAAVNMLNTNPMGAPAGNPFPQFGQQQFAPNMMHNNAQGGMNPYMANPGMPGANTMPAAAPSIKDVGINSLFNFQPEVAQMQHQLQGMNMSGLPPSGSMPLQNTGANLLGNFQGSMGMQGFMGSTVAPSQGALPSQLGQNRNPGPFF